MSYLQYSRFLLALLPCTLFAAEAPHPPVGIKINLDRPSCVTLAIEDASGNRVRNIVVEDPLPAGENTIWWDAMDDHQQRNVRVHGGHDTSGALVAPGEYTVRGVARDPIDILWRFCPYLPNNPVRTSDRSGQWLSDHRPPCSLLWVDKTQEMIAGAQLAEGAHAIMWLDANGRKIIGNTNIGTHYMGPAKMCRVEGPEAPERYVAWGIGVTRTDLLIVGITADHRTETVWQTSGNMLEDETNIYFSEFDRRLSAFSLAAYGRKLAISLPFQNKIQFLTIESAADGRCKAVPSGEFAVKAPHGLCTDEQGNLYALSEDKLLKYSAWDAGATAQVVAKGLDTPRDVIYAAGKFYVSCQGASHQVWVVSSRAPVGKVLAKIGKAGAPKAGPYDEKKMFHPQGLTLDAKGQLWVAEEDYSPKRISVWNAANGDFVRAFYGPTQYGGGGKVDPKDPTRFYYMGMEFKLDWGKRDAKVVDIFDRREWPNLPRHAEPNDPVYVNNRQYMVNVWNGDCTRGTSLAAIYRYDKDGTAHPVALVGQLAEAKSILDDPAIKAKFDPRMVDRVMWHRGASNKLWEAYQKGIDALFAWSDLNGDAKIQPEEITVCPGLARGFNMKTDTLDLIAGDGTRIDVQSFTPQGVPVYDLTKAYGRGKFQSGEQEQIVIGKDGSWCSLLYAPEIAKINGLTTNANGTVKWHGGAWTGRTADGHTWFAPNAWSSLHAAQLFPTDRKPWPGEIVGATKINGPTFTLGPDKIECFSLNSNSGIIYIMSVDGYFIAPLFKHGLWSKPWENHVLEYDESVADRSSDGEGFFQAFTKCENGKCYIQALNHTSSLCEVLGLDSLRRLPSVKVTVTKDDITRAKEYYVAAESARLKKEGAKSLDCTFGGDKVTIDGKWDDWQDTEWAYLDEKVEAAVKSDGKMLYAAWHTCHRNLTKNSGADPWFNMFKTGGALDLMIGPKATPRRLLISEVDGKMRAILYVPKTKRKGHAIGISSPNRTVNFDFIADVSDKVLFAKSNKWPFTTRSFDRGANKSTIFHLRGECGEFYEIGIALNEIGVKIQAGTTLVGDCGVLVGDGSSVRQRLCWNNKGTQNLFDAPDEAILRPDLWGTFRFRRPSNASFKGIKTLDTETGGLLAVSSQPKVGAGITFEGVGELARRRVGTAGWVLFRFSPEEKATGGAAWYTTDTRFAASDIVRWPANITDPSVKDGFVFSAGDNYRFKTALDGKEKKGYIGGGGALAMSFEHSGKRIAWDIGLTDTKPHTMTIAMSDNGLKKSHLDIVENGEKRRLYDFEGGHPLRFIQFTVKGDFTLIIEQDPWEKGEKRLGEPTIIGFFID